MECNRLDRKLTLLSTLANTALKIWSLEPNVYQSEIARTTFLKSKVFKASGKGQNAVIALKVAARLRGELLDMEEDPEDLVMADFDSMVAFWSR